MSRDELERFLTPEGRQLIDSLWNEPDDNPEEAPVTGWTPPGDLDPEITELVIALNALPGITTYSSCCGHGRMPVSVHFFFRRDKDLARLLYYLAPCHGAPQGWGVDVRSDCGMSGPFYGVQGPPGDYEGGRAIAALLGEEDVR